MDLKEIYGPKLPKKTITKIKLEKMDFQPKFPTFDDQSIAKSIKVFKKKNVL